MSERGFKLFMLILVLFFADRPVALLGLILCVEVPMLVCTEQALCFRCRPSHRGCCAQILVLVHRPCKDIYAINVAKTATLVLAIWAVCCSLYSHYLTYPGNEWCVPFPDLHNSARFSHTFVNMIGNRLSCCLWAGHSSSPSFLPGTTSQPTRRHVHCCGSRPSVIFCAKPPVKNSRKSKQMRRRVCVPKPCANDSC
jgi:hypothetical protein